MSSSTPIVHGGGVLLGDLDSEKNKDKIPIRYAIGTTSYSIIMLNEMLINGLKSGNGVIIIHKDDFKRIMGNTLGFEDFKTKIKNITEIMDSWK